ncbi:MAG: hypothetical protein U5L76_03270 [Patescibacteria group bacterium]|nr:hypothetical protein [Patescibacteria group bacterium]
MRLKKINWGRVYLLSILVVFILLLLVAKLIHPKMFWVVVVLTIAYISVAPYLYQKAISKVKSLAKIGHYFAICPHNKMLFIMDYNKINKVIINSPTELREHVLRWKKEMEQMGVQYKIILLDEHDDGLIWIGFHPRFTVQAFSWSEYESEDEVRHSLFMGDEVIRLLSQYREFEKDKEGNIIKDGTNNPIKKELSSGYDPHGVPLYESGDPAGVAVALDIILRFWDYEKAAFTLKKPKDTFKDLILEVLRRILPQLKFFREGSISTLKESAEDVETKLAKMKKGEVKVDEEEIKRLKAMEEDLEAYIESYQPEIIKEAQSLLRLEFGIGQTLTNIKLMNNKNIELFEKKAQKWEREVDLARKTFEKNHGFVPKEAGSQKLSDDELGTAEEYEESQKKDRGLDKDKDQLEFCKLKKWAEKARNEADGVWKEIKGDDNQENSEENRGESEKREESKWQEKDGWRKDKGKIFGLDEVALLENPYLFTPNSKAAMIWKRYGTQIIDLPITDLEEISGLRDNLEEMLKALIQRRKAIIESSGKARAEALRGAGIRESVRQQILAFETKPKSGNKLSEQARSAYLITRGWEAQERLAGEEGKGRVVFTQGVGNVSDMLAKAGLSFEVGRDILPEEVNEVDEESTSSRE